MLALNVTVMKIDHYYPVILEIIECSSVEMYVFCLVKASIIFVFYIRFIFK